jgi:uncharacterized iron-regulated membrane protein
MASTSRIVVRRIHLWIGLSVGLLFVLLGLTGSALVFYQEIDTALHPAIRRQATAPAPGWNSPVWDRALGTLRARWPDDGGQWRLEATGDPGPIPARHYPGGTAAGHMTRRMMIWLSPDGARILRHDRWGDYAMSWIYELHMDLLSGEAGHQLVGWSGLVFALLLLTGLAAWWPRGGWRKAAAFKRRAVPLRRLHDIHKLTGLIGLPLLLLFALTGFLLALPAQSDRLLAGLVGPVDTPPAPRSTVLDAPQISLTAALAAGHRALPQARLAWIEVPPPGAGVIKLRVQVPGDPSRRFPHSYIHIDQYSGRVLAIQDARTSGLATTITNWLHPLHDASVGGLPTRLLAFLAGLLPAILFTTGLWRWRLRRARRAPSIGVHT